MTATVIGTGVLTWGRHERVTDRYGTVWLMPDPDRWDPAVDLDVSAVDTVGTLTAEVLETRDSDHIGDLFRGIFPTTPGVGDVIELGRGALFTETEDGHPVVGLRPDDGRTSDWLDPHALYRAHSQTVRLTFIPED